jgi:phosphate transport system protein
MNTKREQSIQDISKNFEEMSDLVLGQLTLLEKLMADQANTHQDKVIAEINQNEEKIDRFEVLISDQIINSIVLYQPVASDIRKIMAIYRISINLERVGDLIMNIIYSLESIEGSPEYKDMHEVLMNMLLSGVSMVEKSLLSFINGDADYAIWAIKNDEVVDDMNRKLLLNSIKKSKVKEKTREMLLSYVDLKNIIINLERIADHATNIAEASIYSLQGTDIRHTYPDAHPDVDPNKGNFTGETQ